jgi:hypothetical protein
MFGSMFYFGGVFESVFDNSDVFGNSILTHDVFVSRLQSDVNKHLVCNLAMLINCNYFWCEVFDSVFNFGDVLGVSLIMVTC